MDNQDQPFTASGLACRRVQSGDLGEIADFIATRNSQPATESLHCPRAGRAAVRGYLLDAEIFPDGWEHWFFKAVEPNGRMVALLGCQPELRLGRGWLWGPWSGPSREALAACGPLLAEFARQRHLAIWRAEAFLNVENRGVLEILRSAGFVTGIETQLYTASAPGGALSVHPPAVKQEADEKGGFSFLRAAHETAFLRLHAETFPAAPQSGQELLDTRGEEQRIITAADGLRLLGYVCLSINRVPREGFIDYLGVKASARGRGVGRWLLAQAQRWFFEVQALPQASLCVTGWREEARRLYERTGFRWQATGVAARLRYRRG